MCARRKAKTRRPARVQRFLRVLVRAGLLCLLCCASYWLALELGTRTVSLPEALLRPPTETLVLEDRAGRELAVLGGKRARASEAASLSEMGDWLPKVTVALEDRRFWKHDGVDWRSIAGSLRRNLQAGHVVSGGATIAQQLIKTSAGRSGWRWWAKAREALAARKLTRLWSRERILEEYLNRIDYGNRRLGPRAAARAYFGKEPADLSLAEAIYLAGLPQSPTRHNPWRHPEQARLRYQRSLAVLSAAGVLTPMIRETLGLEPPALARLGALNRAPHFVDTLLAGRPDLRGRVRSTLDLELQGQVERLVREHLAGLQGRGVGQAAVLVLDNRDSSVLALVGSADYAGPEGEINGATLPRSCGSVLKPFLYLEALERGLFTAASVLPDTPDAIRAEYIDYDPRNFDERYLGPVRMREALASSLNVPAVYTLAKVGARPFFERLQDWGFRFPRDLKDYGAGLILGNAELRLVDLACAFSGLAGGGRVHGLRLLTSDPETTRTVCRPETAAIITDILCDDDARRRAFGRASVLAVPRRVPCKTGTSSGFRDAWTVGSTAQHTVAVWAGNFDGRPMQGAASIEAAAPLWRSVVDVLLQADTGVPGPVQGAGLSRREVCRLSGLLPVTASPGRVEEWFLRGTEPKALASEWYREYEGRMQLVLPSEYAVWCRSSHNMLGARTDLTPAFRLLVPAEAAVYVLDPSLPARQQMLLLEADLPPGAEAVWRINSEKVAPTNGLHLWPLRAGEWEACVECLGQVRRARFRVQ